MAQIEVFEYLRELREKGNNDYQSCEAIARGMYQKANGKFSTYVNLIRGAIFILTRYDYIDFQMDGSIFKGVRVYRIKKKYCRK
jgi:hypothetical protein